MADVKIEIAEDQERGTDRVMVSGGNREEGIVLKDTIEGALIEACRRAEGFSSSAIYDSVVLGSGLMPLLREHLGLPPVEDDE